MEMPQIIALAMIGIIIFEFILGSILKRRKIKRLLEKQEKEEENE